jgi:beta-glucanase (GH16 family)
MVGNAGARRQLGIALTVLLTLALVVNPSADAASKKTLKLLWSDEFNSKKGAKPSAKNWVYEIGGGGWGNSERQYYTDSLSNIATDGQGKLVITANRISTASMDSVGTDPATELMLYRCSECQFSSARIKTARKLAFKYGRIEARMKMPQGVGTWPAFWMLGGDLLEGSSWPECGEIDIMEFRGDISERSTSALHGPNTPIGTGLGTSYLSYAPLSDDYHTYAIEWRKNSIDFIVDGSVTGTYSSKDTGTRGWVFNQEFFLILNLAVGGTYAGEEIDPDMNQAEFKIDYIRYYSVNGVGKLTRK